MTDPEDPRPLWIPFTPPLIDLYAEAGIPRAKGAARGARLTTGRRGQNPCDRSTPTVAGECQGKLRAVDFAAKRQRLNVRRRPETRFLPCPQDGDGIG